MLLPIRHKGSDATISIFFFFNLLPYTLCEIASIHDITRDSHTAKVSSKPNSFYT